MLLIRSKRVSIPSNVVYVLLNSLLVRAHALHIVTDHSLVRLHGRPILVDLIFVSFNGALISSDYSNEAIDMFFVFLHLILI